MTGTQVNTDLLEWIEGDIGVNVNVFSGRLSSLDNWLSCDFIDGELVDVRSSSPVHLHCALIDEDREPLLKP
ncbi:hypothetical protein [Pelagibacterium sp. H642]|uniref:hypothetical protein n=1 Tax=Pelagibacterium sp. H642 TaxID=1881069 RepID=UPI002814D281|nr:hypothetical protein [Pelagibacterium sp. H642]WMT91959.1 hypothetical protein NO934_06805 [Pelagibacterium sp. H642]